LLGIEQRHLAYLLEVVLDRVGRGTRRGYLRGGEVLVIIAVDERLVLAFLAGCLRSGGSGDRGRGLRGGLPLNRDARVSHGLRRVVAVSGIGVGQGRLSIGTGIQDSDRILVLVKISQVDIDVDFEVSDRGEVGDVEVRFHVDLDLDLDVHLKVIRWAGATRFAALASSRGVRAGILVGWRGGGPTAPGTLLDRRPGPASPRGPAGRLTAAPGVLTAVLLTAILLAGGHRGAIRIGRPIVSRGPGAAR